MHAGRDLTPFFGAMPGAFVRAVRDAWGLDCAVEVRGDHVAVELQVGLVLKLREGRESAWSLGRFGVEVERSELDGDRRAALEHLAGWFGGERDDTGLVQSLDDLWRFRDQRDRGVARIESTSLGPVGTIRLGYRCNQDCWFCPQDRTWRDPSRALVEDWLASMRDAGVTLLTLTGGEPTAYPWMLDLLETADTYGIQTVLQTNAIRFSSARFVERAVDAGLCVAFVSFHSHDPAVSDALTRSPGTHAKTVQGIHNLLDRGVTVALNTCIVRDNVQGLPEHAAFIARSFVHDHPDNPLLAVDLSQPGEFFDNALFEPTMVPYDEVRAPLVQAVHTLQDAGVVVAATGTCGFPPCLFRDEPAILPWQRAADERLDHDQSGVRTYGAVCDACAGRPWCPGLRRQAFALHGDRGLRPWATVPDVPRVVRRIEPLEVARAARERIRARGC